LTDGISRERALARLDREWQVQRQQYMIANRYGQRIVPTRSASVLAGAAAVGFGLVWAVSAAQIAGGGDVLSFVGILFMLFGLIVSCLSYAKARRYQRAYDLYRRRRQVLLTGDEDE
jgi:hypothetical protein